MPQVREVALADRGNVGSVYRTTVSLRVTDSPTAWKRREYIPKCILPFLYSEMELSIQKGASFRNQPDHGLGISFGGTLFSLGPYLLIHQ